MAKDSSGSRLPWMTLWTRDLMAEPAIQLLPWDKRGRYLWALVCSWETDHPGVAEQKTWAAWMGYNTETWEDARDDFYVLFKEHPDYPDEVWIQSRLQREYESAKAESDKRSAAGIKANSIRWHSGGNPIGLRPVSPSAAVPEAVTEESKTKTNPSRERRSRGIDFSEMDLPDWLPREAWREWTAYRKESGKSLTELSAKRCVSKLDELRGLGDDPKAAIEQSIASGWTGLFGTSKKHTNGFAPPVLEVLPTKRMNCHYCHQDYFVLRDKAASSGACDSCATRMAK